MKVPDGRHNFISAGYITPISGQGCAFWDGNWVGVGWGQTAELSGNTMMQGGALRGKPGPTRRGASPMQIHRIYNPTLPRIQAYPP